MNRRTLLKGMAATAAGLILPPTLAENVEAATSGSRCSWCGVKVSPLMSSSWVVREPGSPAVLGCDACIYRDSQSRTRYWSLDQTMLGSGWLTTERFDAQLPGWGEHPAFAEWVEALESPPYTDQGTYVRYPIYRGFTVIINRQPSYEGAPYRTWTFNPTVEFLP